MAPKPISAYVIADETLPLKLRVVEAVENALDGAHLMLRELWAATTSSVRQSACGLNGHLMVPHLEPDWIALRCAACGATTAGWALDVHPVFARELGAGQSHDVDSRNLLRAAEAPVAAARDSRESRSEPLALVVSSRAAQPRECGSAAAARHVVETPPSELLHLYRLGYMPVRAIAVGPLSERAAEKVLMVRTR